MRAVALSTRLNRFAADVRSRTEANDRVWYRSWGQVSGHGRQPRLSK